MDDFINLIREELRLESSIFDLADLNHLKLVLINSTDAEICNTRDELEMLRNDLDKFPRLYCKKYGHNYVTTDYYYIGKTGSHFFIGDEILYSFTSKCTVCGANSYIELPIYSFPDKDIYKKELPDGIYDDQSLTINGKTYRMTEEEISRLEDYLSYLHSLKRNICNLVGHTMERKRQYRCFCCGKTMSWNDYNNYLKDKPVTLVSESFLLLPTFE